jgi:hypothetical protein
MLRLRKQISLTIVIGVLGLFGYNGCKNQAQAFAVEPKDQDSVQEISDLEKAMLGYPEKIFNIEAQETREALANIFRDKKTHLVVPVKFSINKSEWEDFSTRVKEYLEKVSVESKNIQTSSTKSEWSFYDPRAEKAYLNKWERQRSKGESTFFGRFRMSPNSSVYSRHSVRVATEAQVKHDEIYDVIIVLDSKLKSGKSYAVSRDTWDSIDARFKQVCAFDILAIDKDGSEIGTSSPESNKVADAPGNVVPGEFYYSTLNAVQYVGFVSSLPVVTGFEMRNGTHLASLENFDISGKTSTAYSPRTMLISPFFSLSFEWAYPGDDQRFHTSFSAEYIYEYIVDLELAESEIYDHVEIDLFVLDLYNKTRDTGRGECNSLELESEICSKCGQVIP